MKEKQRCRAMAMIKGSSAVPQLTGVVWLTDTPAGVRVEAQVKGLPRSETGFYGFHLHERGSCQPPDFASAKGHYNPLDVPHPQHAGDFPMLMATGQNEAWLSFMTTRFSVCDVIGRSIVIHAQRDDYTSQPAGDAGERIGCGIIQAV